jgi:hypothetical protein
VARSLGRQVYEVSDAGHNMEMADDPVQSVGLLRLTTAVMDAFVRTL